MTKIIPFLIFLLLLNVPQMLYSHTGLSNVLGTEGHFAIGPSFSTISINNDSGPKNKGYSLNIDTSYTFSDTLLKFTPSINLKFMNINGESNYGLQAEFTIWAFVNIGGGFGHLFGDNGGSVDHYFIGLPILYKNVSGFFEILYLEPYYRLNFFNDNKYHEIGILFKFSTVIL